MSECRTARVVKRMKVSRTGWMTGYSADAGRVGSVIIIIISSLQGQRLYTTLHYTILRTDTNSRLQITVLKSSRPSPVGSMHPSIPSMQPFRGPEMREAPHASHQYPESSLILFHVSHSSTVLLIRGFTSYSNL